MAIPMNAFSQAIEALLRSKAQRATKYLSEREKVSAHRLIWNGRIDARDTRTTLVVTFGRPNYAERQFIRKCKQAGEPFPVKKIQLKFPPKRRR